ncbi:MAG: hypothetical protein IKY15_02925 [Clostridia bacterium]|nr:hypothetical protein [Clostridia bacterium]
MKKFVKCLCVGMLSAVTISLSGCFLSFDPDSSTTGLKSIDGFKVCYSDNNYVLDNTFERYSNHILTNLVGVFGVPNSQIGIESRPLSSNSKNYDRIRVQYAGGPAISTGWKWTFAQGYGACLSQQEETNVVDYYTTEKAGFYAEEYVSIYQNALAVVIMQIASGQAPQVFTVEVNETTGQTKVFANTAKTEEIDTDYLSAEKAKFAQNGLYVGFTAENVTTFKNYVLTNVVGSAIIGTQYDSVATTTGTKNYSALLDEIFALNTGFEKEFLNPYPACSAKDVTDTSLYPLSSGTDSLNNITPYEYQSVTLMPNRALEIMSLTLSLSAETAMNIDILAYYYNAQTQTQELLFEGTSNLKANKVQQYLVPFADIVVMDKFDNTNTKIEMPSQITNQNGLSTQFSYQGGAVLQEGNKSYLTIVFKPQGAINAYMPFKVAISSLFIGE